MFFSITSLKSLQVFYVENVELGSPPFEGGARPRSNLVLGRIVGALYSSPL